MAKMTLKILLFIVGDWLLVARSSSAQASFSERCDDPQMYWRKDQNACRPCTQLVSLSAGYEYSPNCGQDDISGTRGPIRVPCPAGKYNDGRYPLCQVCKVCPPDQPRVLMCNRTTDAQCCRAGEEVINGQCLPKRNSTQAPTTLHTTETATQPTTTKAPTMLMTQETTTRHDIRHNRVWMIVLAITVCFVAAAAAALFYVIKRRRGPTFETIGENDPESRKDSFPHPRRKNHQLFGLKTSEEKPSAAGDPKPPILALAIEKAPVSAVLDNLDVLEELVMLLDPEHPGTKNTRHVAARCSFSATWVNYSYSMRGTRSPLKAVLEGVSTKFPEWTIGNLAGVFRDIGRNDAVMVLSKLPFGQNPADSCCL